MERGRAIELRWVFTFISQSDIWCWEKGLKLIWPAFSGDLSELHFAPHSRLEVVPAAQSGGTETPDPSEQHSGRQEVQRRELSREGPPPSGRAAICCPLTAKHRSGPSSICEPIDQAPHICYQVHAALAADVFRGGVSAWNTIHHG